MKFSEFIEHAVFYISVPKCISCNEKLDFTSKVYCPECKLELFDAYSRECSKCFKVLSQCTCSNEYLKSKRVKQVIKLFRYIQREENYAANSLIYSLKKDNRRDCLELASDMLCHSLLNAFDNFDNIILTNVPRRRIAIIKRGFDHASMLSKRIAKKLNATYIPLFVSKTKKAQKSLGPVERRKNPNFTLRANKTLDGKTVVIVDDVITTGASIGACADLAYSLGARNVVAAALGIAYKDMS